MKETAAVMIGAVASQVGAAAGAEIIGVGERYVSKHAAPEPTVDQATNVFGEGGQNAPGLSTAELPPPLFIPAIAPPNVLPMSNEDPKSSFPAMAPLPAPNVSKNEPRHPERRILKVRRPSARESNTMYQKDNVDELSERMSHLSQRLPKRGAVFLAATDGGAVQTQLDLNKGNKDQ